MLEQAAKAVAPAFNHMGSKGKGPKALEPPAFNPLVDDLMAKPENMVPDEPAGGMANLLGGMDDMMKGDDMASMMKLMDTAAKFDPNAKEKPTDKDVGDMENFMKMMDDPNQIDKHPMG